MIIKPKVIFKCINNKVISKSFKNKDNFTFPKIFRLSLIFKKIECLRLSYLNQIFKVPTKVPASILINQKVNRVK